MFSTDHDPTDRPLIAGRYRLHALVGRGGMASVWRAQDEVLHRPVAVKLFAAPGLPNPDATMADPGAGPATSGATPEDRISTEIRLLAQLNHPNIVSVYDAVHDGEGRFECLVMELIDGVSLRERLHDGPLTPVQVAGLGRDLATGLDYVHRGGIVHRDIKPANILLEGTSHGERAKLVDFGIARLVDGASMTMDGITMGTPGYLSPEQASGAPAGPPSDIYALGLVLLECLTGQRAFPGHGVETASARLHRDPPTERVHDPRWRELLRSMTARDPGARPDAATVAISLDQLVHSGPTLVAVEPITVEPAAVEPTVVDPIFGEAPADDTARLSPAAAPVRSSRRRWEALAAAAVAVGLTAALVSVLAARDNDDNSGSVRPSNPPTVSSTRSSPTTPTPTPSTVASTRPTSPSTAVVVVSRTTTAPAAPVPHPRPPVNKPTKKPKPPKHHKP